MVTSRHAASLRRVWRRPEVAQHDVDGAVPLRSGQWGTRVRKAGVGAWSVVRRPSPLPPAAWGAGRPTECRPGGVSGRRETDTRHRRVAGGDSQ